MESTLTAATYADAAGQYTKLPSGAWGIRVFAKSVAPGDLVLVTTKAGSQAIVTVGAVVPSKYAKPGEIIASIAKPAPAPAVVADPVKAPGVFRTPIGTIFQVTWNKSKTGLYAKRFHPATRTFEYESSAIYTLTEAMRLTLETAKALSVAFSACICCGLKLTNPKSMARGIGPVCIKKYF